jgi:hypothetical protein
MTTLSIQSIRCCRNSIRKSKQNANTIKSIADFLKQLFWKQNKYTDNNQRQLEKFRGCSQDKQTPIQDNTAIANYRSLRARPTSASDDGVQQQGLKRRRLSLSRSQLSSFSRSPVYSPSKAPPTGDQEEEEEESILVVETTQGLVVPIATMTTSSLPDDEHQGPESTPTYCL